MRKIGLDLDGFCKKSFGDYLFVRHYDLITESQFMHKMKSTELNLTNFCGLQQG